MGWTSQRMQMESTAMKRHTRFVALALCAAGLQIAGGAAAVSDADPSTADLPIADASRAMNVAPEAAAGDVTFDWKNVPIAVVVQAVVGDLLGDDYEIAAGVTGTVTYKTLAPITRWQALAVLEQQLAANGSVLVRTGRGYLIQPARDP